MARTSTSAAATADARDLRRWLAVALLVCLAAVYLYKPQYRLDGQSGDTNPNQLLPISLLIEGDFDFDEFLPAYRGYWFHQVGTRYESVVPLLPGLLNLPVFAVAHAFGVPLQEHAALLSLVSGSLITIASSLFFFLFLCARLPQPTAFAWTLVYGFGTCAWSVASRGIWQHGPSLLFISAFLWLVTTRPRGWTVLTGFVAGLAFVNRPTNALVLAVPLLWVLWQNRRAWSAFVAGGAVPVFVTWVYSLLVFDSHIVGFYPSAFVASNSLRGNLLEGLAGLLISPGRGLLVFSPFFLVSAVGIARALRRPGEHPFDAALALSVFPLLLFFATWSSWWGGYSFGYRLLIELVPVLTFFAALAWHQTFRRTTAGRAVVAVAVALSLYIHFLGAMYYPSKFNERLAARDPAPLWDTEDTEIIRLHRRFTGDPNGPR